MARTDFYRTADGCDEQEFGMMPSTHGPQFTLKIERREPVCARWITSDKRISRHLSGPNCPSPSPKPSFRLRDYTSTGQRVRPGGSACSSKMDLRNTDSVLSRRKTSFLDDLSNSGPTVRQYSEVRASEPHATCRGSPQPSRCPNLDIDSRKRASPNDAAHGK